MFTTVTTLEILRDVNDELFENWKVVLDAKNQHHELHRGKYAFWIDISMSELVVQPGEGKLFKAEIRIRIEAEEFLPEETHLRLVSYKVYGDEFCGGVRLVNGTSRNGVPDYAQWMATLTIVGPDKLVLYLRLKEDN